MEEKTKDKIIAKQKELIALYESRLGAKSVMELICIDELKGLEQEPAERKFTPAGILAWIQDGHAVAPVKQVDLLNYMIAFVNHFTKLEQESKDHIEKLEEKCELILSKVREAWTPDHRPFEEIEQQPNKEAREIKKIFNKYCTLANKYYAEYIIRDEKGFLKAIQEYFNQNRKKELIDFLTWLEEEPDKEMITAIVLEYLKPKP